MDAELTMHVCSPDGAGADDFVGLETSAVCGVSPAVDEFLVKGERKIECVLIDLNASRSDRKG